MKRLILLLAITLTACGTVPKTTQEYRKFSEGRDGKHVFTLDESMDSVIARMKKHLEKCNSIYTSTSAWRDGMYSKSSSTLIPRWEKVGSEKATFVLSLMSPGMLNQPKEGFYQHVIDFANVGGKTRVTMYDANVSSWAQYEYKEEFTKVLKKQKAPCQLEEVNKGIF